MRRFHCTAIAASDIPNIHDGVVAIPKGEKLYSEFRALDDPNAEELVLQEFLKTTKVGVWKNVDLEAVLVELPPESAVTVERLLALPEVPSQKYFGSSGELSENVVALRARLARSEAVNRFMDELTPEWANDGVELNLDSTSIQVKYRVILWAEQHHLRVSTFHLGESPFALLVEALSDDCENERDLHILDKDLAQTAVAQIIHARMQALCARITETLSDTTDPQTPLLIFDALGVSFLGEELVVESSKS